MPLHSIAKSGVKPIFSPPPHPILFDPKSPFFLLFPVSNPISGDFTREHARFLPCKVLFFLARPRFASDFWQFSEEPLPFFCPAKCSFFAIAPVLNPISGDFSRDCSRFLTCVAHFFLPFPVSNPISGDFSRDRPTLSPPRSPFRRTRPSFRFGLSSSLTPSSSSSPDLLPFRPSSPLPFTPPPLSLAYLPTFPPLSPINRQTRAPSCVTHVHVRAYTPALQEVFVYCLHPFTHLLQYTVHQHIRCEGKQEKAFTYRTTNSLSTN